MPGSSPGMRVTPPHPEEHRGAMHLEGCRVATWFETRSCAALLTMRLTLQYPITLLRLLRVEIHVAPHLLELGAHLRHPVFNGAGDVQAHRRRIVQRRGV